MLTLFQPGLREVSLTLGGLGEGNLAFGGLTLGGRALGGLTLGGLGLGFLWWLSRLRWLLRLCCLLGRCRPAAGVEFTNSRATARAQTTDAIRSMGTSFGTTGSDWVLPGMTEP